MVTATATRNGAEVLLDTLLAQGVEHLFCSPIAVWAPVWEALARRKAEGVKAPTYWSTRHEDVSVAAAIGYYKMTGRPAAVLLATGVATLHAAMAIRAAYQERIPVILLAADTLTWGQDPSLDPGSEWPRVLGDLVGPARLADNFVKWALDVKSSSTLVSSLQRACTIAQAVPRGPVILSVPFDAVMATIPENEAVLRGIEASALVAEPAAVHRAARLLTESRSPLIITGFGGRAPEDVASLVKLAESLGAPVVESRGAIYMNFPRTHPLHAGYQAEEAIGRADCILIAGSQAPWHPPLIGPRPECRVIVLDEEPLRPRSPYWGYRTDLVVTGDVGLNLQALSQAVHQTVSGAPEVSARAQERAARLRTENEARRAQWVREAEDHQNTRPIDPRWLSYCLNQLLPPSAAVVDELIVQSGFAVQQIPRSEPLTYFRGNHGGMGTGLPVALGIKMGDPSRLVTCLVGDGNFNYNPTLAALGFAQEYDLPILVVIYNNEGWGSQRALLVHYFAEGWALKTGNTYGIDIKPTPDYAAVAQVFGGYGERVTDPDEVLPALCRGLEAVQQGRIAVIDVIIRP